MLRRLTLASVTALLLGALPAAAADTCETVAGHVKRGDLFEQPLSDDLVFRLVPDSLGWTIVVGLRDQPGEDFVGVATPPFRGTNHRFLEGWHFRNRANTGPNVGDVNAPQHERVFRFARSAAGYRQAADAVDALLWGAPTQPERERAMEALEEASQGQGTLHIRAMTLGNLTPGAQAWFETLDFDAELCRPR